MTFIAEYLIKMICAAMLLSVINHLFKEKGAVQTLIKMISGIYLAVILISPLIHLKINDEILSIDSFYEEAMRYCDDGEQISDNQKRQHIKESAESYVISKAEAMNARLNVEITLSEDDENPYKSIVLEGDLSPYVKEQLSNVIKDDLGISLEAQKWIN